MIRFLAAVVLHVVLVVGLTAAGMVHLGACHLPEPAPTVVVLSAPAPRGEVLESLRRVDGGWVLIRTETWFFPDPEAP